MTSLVSFFMTIQDSNPVGPSTLDRLLMILGNVSRTSESGQPFPLFKSSQSVEIIKVIVQKVFTYRLCIRHKNQPF